MRVFRNIVRGFSLVHHPHYQRRGGVQEEECPLHLPSYLAEDGWASFIRVALRESRRGKSSFQSETKLDSFKRERR